MSEFVLDAYAARSCPVKTQNRFLPGIEPPSDESLAEAFTGGSTFTASILDALAQGAGTVVDCRPLLTEPWPVQQEVCLAAMAGGADVVISGLLPLDVTGHRSGRPAILVRGANTPSGKPGYHPVIVKFHRVLERVAPSPNRPPLHVSPLVTPSLADSEIVADRAFRGTRELDLLQVAHYWRLLQYAGFAAAGRPWGGVIGTDPEPAGGPFVTWVQLDAKIIRTFSRTAQKGWTLRHALERYDHEHGFRVKVAEVAQRQTGSPDDPPLVVAPIRVRECDRCEWWVRCRPQLDDEDLSLRIPKAPLDVREIAILRRLGVATTTELAAVDLEELLPRYLPEVTHRPGGEERLRLAARRARLMVAGVDLVRETTEPLDLPRADLEIDLDIETSADDRVYLWGFLVTDTRTGEPPVTVQFADFTDLDDAGEQALGEKALGWLHDLVETEPGASWHVYHYSGYEVLRLARLAGHSPALDWGVSIVGTHFVDLFEIMRRNFFGTRGLGLKQVASTGAGFHWRDEDPGGLNSQQWFDTAVHAESASERSEAETRVLEYNEDDVRATHALRAWLRSPAAER